MIFPKSNFWTKWCFILLAAVSLFAFTANPIADWAKTDSAVFYYIGEGMTRGLVPYRDMFDHKGLLIYFLNWLGASLGCGLTGVWVVESLLFIFTICFTWHILKRQFSEIAVLAALCVFVWFFFRVACGGNMTETYATYFITFAWLLLIDDMAAGTLSKKSSFSVGLALGAVAMLRPNMVGIAFPFSVYLCVHVISRREWHELFKHAAVSVLGFMAVVLPCLAYAVWCGIVQEMYKCYIDFNIRYAAANSGAYDPTFWIACGVVALNVVSYLLVVQRRRIMLYSMLFSIVTLLLVIVKMKYEHYFLPLSTCILIPVCVLGEWSWASRMRWCCEAFLSLLLMNFFTYSVLRNNLDFTVVRRMLSGEHIGCEVFRRNALMEVAEFKPYLKDNDSVLVCGNTCLAYYRIGRTSRNRYFYQTVMSFDDSIRRSVEGSIMAGEDKFIVVEGIQKNEIISKYYDLCARSGVWSLWRYAQGSQP